MCLFKYIEIQSQEGTISVPLAVFDRMQQLCLWACRVEKKASYYRKQCQANEDRAVSLESQVKHLEMENKRLQQELCENSKEKENLEKSGAIKKKALCREMVTGLYEALGVTDPTRRADVHEKLSESPEFVKNILGVTDVEAFLEVVHPTSPTGAIVQGNHAVHRYSMDEVQDATNGDPLFQPLAELYAKNIPEPEKATTPLSKAIKSIGSRLWKSLEGNDPSENEKISAMDRSSWREKFQAIRGSTTSLSSKGNVSDNNWRDKGQNNTPDEAQSEGSKQRRILKLLPRTVRSTQT
jgi:hypothetical protein